MNGGAIRRRDELARGAAAGGYLPRGGAGGGFAAQMAATSSRGSGGAARGELWQRAAELASAGGGAAKVSLRLGSGEPAELRVMVRNGLVTVLAQVSDRAAEAAVRGARERISRALEEAGLRLRLLRVRRAKEPRRPGMREAQR